MRRDWIRFRQLLNHLRARLLRWLPEAVVTTMAILIVGGVITATAVGADWTDIFRSQAINVVSGALLAGFAYLLYFLRFRRAELTGYLDSWQLPKHNLEESEEPNPLAKVIVNELLDARPPRACLIKGPANSEHSVLLASVAAHLADKRRVPVVVDLASETGDASLPALTRDRFVTQLVGSSGDAANGRRLYASMVKKEKVVALVRGLDQVGQGMPIASRRAALAVLLEGSLAQQVPFVAWVTDDLAPSISEVAAFRAPPMSDSEFLLNIRQKLQPHAVSSKSTLTQLERPFHVEFDKVEPTRDLALINLALAVLVHRVRSGQDSTDALSTLFADRSEFRRRLRWMCDWALSITLDEIPVASSPVAIALASIGKEAHYQKEPEVIWDDASRGLDTEDRRRFAAGIASLSQRDVVTVSGSGGSKIIRLTDPMWFALAGTLGLKLDSDSWRDLLQPGAPVATLDALTGSLIAFRLRAAKERPRFQGQDQVNSGEERSSERSFLRLLRDVGVDDETRISLEMVIAVIVALQVDEEPLEIGDLEKEVLNRSWSASNDLVRLRFVRLIDFGRDLALIDFLWRQVDYPRFDENSFRIRRAICARLGRLGDTAWRRLNQRWKQLIDTGREEDLSASSRNTDPWRKYENPLASLGWVLPGLLMTVNEDRNAAYQLLEELRAVQDHTRVQARSSGPPDIGLEISLAEGFKAAAVEAFRKRSEAAGFDIGLRRQVGDSTWWSQAVSLLKSSQSWTAQQALLQALALAPLESTSRDVIRSWEKAAERHPFARETARLVGRYLVRHERQAPAILEEDDIWFEAVEALEDGGVTLTPEAHRLLGLSTLLINLAEWRLEGDDGGPPKEEALQTREKVLAGVELPLCFRRSKYAATMFECGCREDESCSFRLCGEDALKGIVEEKRARRVFSRSFLQRAQATASPAPSAPTPFRRLATRFWWAITPRGKVRPFVGKAFESVWRSLDKDLESRGGSV